MGRSWVETETAECDLGEVRLNRCLGAMLEALGDLAITPDGLPLGLTAAKFWSRATFKGTATLKRKINPTRVPID